MSEYERNRNVTLLERVAWWEHLESSKSLEERILGDFGIFIADMGTLSAVGMVTFKFACQFDYRDKREWHRLALVGSCH